MTKNLFVYKNFRKGDFTDHHAKVDVYAKGVKICEYQWNPFWEEGFKLSDELESKLSSGLGASVAMFRKANYFPIWVGKVWGRKLSDSLDKLMARLIWENIKMFECDPKEDDIMYALYSDIESYENCNGFEDWAREFGYDEDSRKAEKIYNEIGEEIKNAHLVGIYDAIMEWGDTHPDY